LHEEVAKADEVAPPIGLAFLWGNLSGRAEGPQKAFLGSLATSIVDRASWVFMVASCCFRLAARLGRTG